MDIEQKKETLQEKLTRMASFESMFEKENLILGVTVWIKSTGIMLVVNLISSLSGLSAMLGSLGVSLFLAIGFYLMYRAIASEAMKRYGLKVLASCWWSFYWRVLVFILPVIFFLTLMIPDSYSGMTPEQMVENPEPIFYLQIAALVLSIIPSGLAASRAILVSFQRISMLAGQGPVSQQPKNEEKKSSEDSSEKRD